MNEAGIQYEERPWTVDDPRMWQHQCRIGDVAFQHLFVTAKADGSPMPDWVVDGLPSMYATLEYIKNLELEIERLLSEIDQ